MKKKEKSIMSERDLDVISTLLKYSDWVENSIPSEKYGETEKIEDILSKLYFTTSQEYGESILRIHLRNQEVIELHSNSFRNFIWNMKKCGKVMPYTDDDGNYTTSLIYVSYYSDDLETFHQMRIPISEICFAEHVMKDIDWHEEWGKMPYDVAKRVSQRYEDAWKEKKGNK